ncbi:ImmA/IrrE family metallo-endopeptidase [Anaerospora hongkongensis]|uniref:ImmA/IrrE family metallo-endopeptidase n=1 Tax=Anaerospora hongkongensis TaxID=244830 RepID=UPI0028972E68|nr:ImmA/IrrE family metallo-endopeptidase [Anaerospora hongkongensis]
MNIKLRATNLVKKFKTSNPREIADDLGIDVLYLDLPLPIRGFLVRVLRRKIIVVNKILSSTGQIVTLCHELGHVRLHPGYGYYYHATGTRYVSSRCEREANEFALHLLSQSRWDCLNTKQWQDVFVEKRPDPKLVHRILTELMDHDGVC